MYHIFVARLQDLAAASQEQVNDVWAGLGYYRRARLLLEGAQHVQANLSGKIPVNSVELQKIPGVPSNLNILIHAVLLVLLQLVFACSLLCRTWPLV